MTPVPTEVRLQKMAENEMLGSTTTTMGYRNLCHHLRLILQPARISNPKVEITAKVKLELKA
ncbi:hypothetical protein DVH24_011539 [Malus domestica]|uniref:Uncharacterized protein n=1 Tax=Malus domestica TaxID=3750 RepID=A0A498JZT5_MALDO|nr:hypothetical protein DVH24_011539 [Malus domestica]